MFFSDMQLFWKTSLPNKVCMNRTLFSMRILIRREFRWKSIAVSLTDIIGNRYFIDFIQSKTKNRIRQAVVSASQKYQSTQVFEIWIRRYRPNQMPNHVFMSRQIKCQITFSSHAKSRSKRWQKMEKHARQDIFHPDESHSCFPSRVRISFLPTNRLTLNCAAAIRRC